MRVITGILAVAALTLSGCSQAAEPVVLPSSPDASGPSPTQPTPSAETTPPSASPRDADPDSEVLALIDEYMALTEASVRSQDALDQREELFAASCTVCQDGADTARAILQSGLVVRGGSVAHSAEVLDYDDGIAVVQVSHQIDAIRLIDAEGVEVQSAPATGLIDQVFQIARQEDGEWLVLSVQTLS